MIYGYARVSTKAQKNSGNGLEAQIKTLEVNGAKKIFADTYSGSSLKRPELDKLLLKLRSGDTIILTNIDRLGRNFTETALLIENLINNNIKIKVIGIGLLNNSAVNLLVCNILLAFSQYEKDMIVGRTTAGKTIARTKSDYKEGRPPKYSDEELNEAMLLLANNSYKVVERMTGISKSTLIRAKKQKTEEVID